LGGGEARRRGSQKEGKQEEGKPEGGEARRREARGGVRGEPQVPLKIDFPQQPFYINNNNSNINEQVHCDQIRA
jgi:hypothetical protein